METKHTPATPAEVFEMQADLGETMQILGKALTGDDGIHIGSVPDMARQLVAKLEQSALRSLGEDV